MPYKDKTSPQAQENLRYHRRKHYAENKEQYLRRNKEAALRKAAFLRHLKETTPCTDCGQKFPPEVMEFDHLTDKKTEVAAMLRFSWTQLRAEIAKCELVCANCHSLRTAQRRRQS